MNENRKPGFYWNPELTQKLTPEERRMAAEHERLHLRYVAVTRGVPSELLAEANRAIDAFERGEPCPDPMEGEGLCVAHYPVIGSSRLTDEETDRRIQSLLQTAKYLKSDQNYLKEDPTRPRPNIGGWRIAEDTILNVPGSNPATGESLIALNEAWAFRMVTRLKLPPRSCPV